MSSKSPNQPTVELSTLQQTYKSVTTLKHFLEISLDINTLKNLYLSLSDEEQTRFITFLEEKIYIAIDFILDDSFLKKFRDSGKAAQIREEHYTLKSLLDVAISECFQDNSANVLCSGRNEKKNEYETLNPALSIFNSFEWRLLHSKIDAAWIYFLLTKCSIFYYMKNSKSFLQIVGENFIVRRRKVLQRREKELRDNQVVEGQQKEVVEIDKVQNNKKRRREDKFNPDESSKKKLKLSNDSNRNEFKHSTKKPTPLLNSSRIHLFKDKCFYGTPHISKLGKVIFGFRDDFSFNSREFVEKKPSIESEVKPCLSNRVKFILFQIFPLQFKRHTESRLLDLEEESLKVKQSRRYECLKQYGNANFNKTRLITSSSLSIADIFEMVISRQRKIRYSILMNESCPIEYLNSLFDKTDLRKLNWNEIKNLDLNGLNWNEIYAERKSVIFSPFHHVTKFITLVINQLFPFETFGSKYNWSLLYKKINQYVKLRKSESVSLKFLFEGFKISEIPWLAPKSIPLSNKISKPDFQKRQELFLEFLLWFFDSFLISLIKTNFYVTEVSGGISVVYYRQDIWRFIYKSSMKEFIHEKLERCYKIDDKSNKTISQLGASGVRLIPKQKGYRFIITLGKGITQDKDDQAKSVNSKLYHLHQILTTSHFNHHVKPDSFLSNPNLLFSKLIAFRNKFKVIPEKFYFVKADISSCFDTVNVEKAYEIATSIVKGENFLFQEMDIFGCKVQHPKYSGHFNVVARELTAPLAFEKTITDVYGRKKSERNAIIIDRCTRKIVERKTVIPLLNEHLKRCLVEINKKYYYLRKGIAQGSSISSMLCNLVYDTLVKDCLNFNKENSILFRYVDDFLFISSDKNEAEKFLSLMVRGFPQYGVSINPMKTSTNFIAKIQTKVEPSNNGFSYLGRRINCKSFRPMYLESLSRSELANSTFHRNISDVSAMSSKLVRLVNYQLHKDVINELFSCKISTILKCIEKIAIDIASRIDMFNRICLSKLPPTRRITQITKLFLYVTKLVIGKFGQSILHTERKVSTLKILNTTLNGYHKRLGRRKLYKDAFEKLHNDLGK